MISFPSLSWKTNKHNNSSASQKRVLFSSVLLLINLLCNLDLAIIDFDKPFIKKAFDPLNHYFSWIEHVYLMLWYLYHRKSYIKKLESSKIFGYVFGKVANLHFLEILQNSLKRSQHAYQQSHPLRNNDILRKGKTCVFCGFFSK